MKLTGIQVEAQETTSSTKSARLAAGLNIVVDASPDQASLSQSLRNTLFGLSDGESLPSFHNIDPDTFETFFACDLEKRRTLSAMAGWLHTQAKVAADSHLSPLAEYNGDSPPVGSLRQLRDELARKNAYRPAFHDRLRIFDELSTTPEAADLSRDEGFLELVDRIEQSNARIRVARSRRDLLDRQIIEFERHRSRPNLDFTQNPVSESNESLARLYDRLDEIDSQWRSWREVQQIVHKRRVAIRDELASAAAVDVVPIDHPLQRFRESVQALQAKLEPRDPLCTVLVEVSQFAEQQRRQLNQRTAAAELKQLRACYHDLENGVKRLLNRRHSILEQIHTQDPEGAEFVLQGHQQFCAAALRDGYWSARQQCTPPLYMRPMPLEPMPEFPLDRLQLESLKQQRGEIHQQITQEEATLRHLVTQRDLRINRTPERRPEPIVGILVGTILDVASELLRQCSDGQWTRLRLAERGPALIASNVHGESIEVDRLSTSAQLQMALCLCLAAGRVYERRGMPIPLILREPESADGLSTFRALIPLIGECAARGMQILLVVRDARNVAAYSRLQPNVVHPSPVEPIYRFPIQRPPHWQNSFVPTTTPAEAVREPRSTRISRTSRFRDAGVCGMNEWSSLERLGVLTVGDLLDASPESLSVSLAHGPSMVAQIERWQACCWMLICVPEMGAEDAQVLYECGITAPRQLEEVRGELLLRKLETYLTGCGRRTALARYNVERINRWMRSLAQTRPIWKQLNLRPGMTRSSQPLNLGSSTGNPTTAANVSTPAESQREALRFHLHLNDSVDAAPSIGAKTVEQFAEIGIRSVKDFLSRTADDIARQLNQRRITSDTIRQWQQQARMACSIPNLRRHDAQILVACGITEPEQLASMSPPQLFERVDAFVRSKAGLRLIRSGKKPDLSEATDWIRWARHTRTVQAA